MERFFNFCFKFGKVFSIFLIILCLFSAIGAAIGLFSSLKKVEIKIPECSKISSVVEIIEKSECTPIANDNQAPPYVMAFCEKNNLNEYGRKVIYKHLSKIKDEYRVDYIKGLEKYLPEVMGIFEDGISENDFMRALNDYKKYFFNVALIQKEADKTQVKLNRILDISIIMSSFLIFMFCLVIPLLIKIEENTRNIHKS